MTAKTPFELMMDQAQGMAKVFNPAIESFAGGGFEKLWPTMPKSIMELAFGKGRSKDGLDAKTRLLLTLAGLTVQVAPADTQLRLTVRHLLEAGATKDEITETIGMMSMFAGLPQAINALNAAAEVFEEQESAA